ncbi:hypothetical protein FJY94_01515 [Candidatus Kaiserbacteria bacterium]|nr:hypothetical protein [Candidatus Kaiserbacteria bacterium]
MSASPTPKNNEKLLPPGKPEPAGPLVGTIIIMLVLVFGALFAWGTQLEKRQEIEARNAAAAAAAQQQLQQ